MNRTPHRARLVALCACLALAMSACSDDASGGKDPLQPDADTSTDTDGRADADAGTDAADGPADADNGPEPDGEEAGGLQLEGELVPSGSMSMSNSFTLSGHLSPAMAEQTSSSANFQLELTPAPAETDH